ncbi:MAG: DUF2231 domain-containing protein [Pyrinomonadaceae bacterium]
MSKGLRVFGHPLHAALSHLPMGLLGTAVLWDAVGVWRGEAVWWAVSYWGVAAGLASACVAACAGAVDYAAIEEGDPALTTGSRHLTFVLAALLPYILGMFARGGPEGPRGRGVLAVMLLDGAGALLLAVGGWYGGHLVFHHGVGSDGATAVHLRRERLTGERFDKEGQENDVSTGQFNSGGHTRGA